MSTKKIRAISYNVFRVFILILFLLFAILPLFWIFITSIKTGEELYSIPLVYWPKNPTFDAYTRLFTYSNFKQYFINSMSVTLSSSLVAMILSVMGGFALSRFRQKKLKGWTELLLYFTQTVPSFMIMLPLFMFFSKLKLVDNLPVLASIYVATVIAFSTLMSRSFFDRIPVSLEEAAKIDGCNMLQSIVYVVLPLTLPGIAAIFCFAFVNIWNELFLAVMLINKSSKYTVPVALNSFISKAGVSWDLMSAGIVVSLLPTMVIFGIGQKYIVAGLTEGGVKG
ncbi:MAG: carbohydrate ABC transporter permease [Christensenellaceae bacterium]|nr:carbohydrate ABC transporter permease [Christensenellaceae bacterium]